VQTVEALFSLFRQNIDDTKEVLRLPCYLTYDNFKFRFIQVLSFQFVLS
jgi:hypothetical protein